METLYTIENEKGTVLLTIVYDLMGTDIIYGYLLGTSKVMVVCSLEKLSHVIDNAYEKGFIVRNWNF